MRRRAIYAILAPLLAVAYILDLGTPTPAAVAHAEEPAAALAASCVAGDELPAAVSQRLLALGSRTLKALFLADLTSIAVLSDQDYHNPSVAATLKAAVEPFWPSRVPYQPGAPLFLAMAFPAATTPLPSPSASSPPTTGEGMVYCPVKGLLESQQVRVRFSHSDGGAPLAVLLYRFGAPDDPFVVIITAVLRDGRFRLRSFRGQEMAVAGRGPQDFAAMADEALTSGDRAVARLFYVQAARLVPGDAELSFDVQRRWEQAAIDNGDPLPTVESPAILRCPSLDAPLWELSLFPFDKALLLRAVYHTPELTDAARTPREDCVLSVLRSRHPRLNAYFDALLLEGRPLPPDRQGQYHRRTIPLR